MRYECKRYIGTLDSNINIARVAARVLRGGHHIPTDDIIRRWDRSVDGLPRYLKAVDTAWIVDNSEEQPRLIAKIVGGASVALYPPVPIWAKQALIRL
jgi:predicted ABC-type ATPase